MTLGTAASREPLPKGKPLRQAIVLVHGMGEQVPMETMRDFANAVWLTDSDLHTSSHKAAGELFSVPDPNSGSRELRRISTRKSRPRVGPGESYSVRNEFFELYWADSTNDTTWKDFLRWYSRLVFRSPSNVPHAVKWIWILLWVVNFLFVLTAEITVLWLVETEIDKVVAKCVNWLEAYKAAIRTDTSTNTLTIMLIGAVAAAGGWIAYSCGFLKKAALWIGGVGAFIGVWCFIVLLGLFLKPLIIAPAKEYYVFWPGFVALISAFLLLLQGFLIKFFGDVGRYTVASPGNIIPRQKVRDRGIALIKQLSATGQYDRIVLVAHSLGCIVAYDILCLLWSDYVSTRDKPEDLAPTADGMLSEVQAVVDATRAKPFDVAAFRAAQRSFFVALQKADRDRLNGVKLDKDGSLTRWLISDLVTIANPLTHADFLMARNKKDLGGRFDWRELSRCPPTLEKGNDGKTFHLTYRKDGTQASRFIHDATFAGVRWTSIHDQPITSFRFLSGDCIAGPVAKWFGEGVVDVKVEPRWKSDVLPERFFTHTIYWEMRQSYAGGTPPSVRVIRNAVNLLDEDAAEIALLAEAKRTATPKDLVR